MAELRRRSWTVTPGDIRRPPEADERRAQRRGQSAASAFRPHRNGIPLGKPYRYKGLGYDQYPDTP